MENEIFNLFKAYVKQLHKLSDDPEDESLAEQFTTEMLELENPSITCLMAANSTRAYSHIS